MTNQYKVDAGAVDERTEALIHTLRGFSKAYPEDIFPPLDDAVRHAIIEAYPGAIDRISAAMGRHCAKFMAQAADALEAALSRQPAQTVSEQPSQPEASKEGGADSVWDAAARFSKLTNGGWFFDDGHRLLAFVSALASQPVAQQPAQELPPLPEPAGTVFDDGYWTQNKNGPLAALPHYASRRGDFFTVDQMRAGQREAFELGLSRVQSAAPAAPAAAPNVDEMVNRFLGWPLPKDFAPDCGISFDGRKDDEWNKNKTWPIGTNLLTAEQAKAMFLHCLPAAPQPVAAQVGELANSIEYQQQRGAHADIIDEAITTYEQYMLDDDFDAQGALNRIIERMRDRRAFYAAHPQAAQDKGGNK